MDEDAPHTMRWHRVFAPLAGYMVLAVGLYVLSIGPASYLFFWRSEALDNLYRRFYAPIHWLHDETDFMDAVMQYDEWWWALPGGPIERIRNQPRVPAEK